MEKPQNAEQGQSGELVPRPKVVPPVRTFEYRRIPTGIAAQDAPRGVLGHYITYTIAGGVYVEEIVHTHARGVQLVTRLSLAPGTWYDIKETLDEELAH